MHRVGTEESGNTLVATREQYCFTNCRTNVEEKLAVACR
jgi:hypothetical protein